MIKWNEDSRNGGISPLHREEVEVVKYAVMDLSEKRLNLISDGTLEIFGRYNWSSEYAQITKATITNEKESARHLVAKNQTSPVESIFQLAVESDGAIFHYSGHRIYVTNTTYILSLDCGQGRFFASCRLPSEDFLYPAHEILIAIALILSDLRPQDHVLRASCQELWQHLDQDILDAVANVSHWEKRFFYHSPYPALADWRKWRRDWEKVAELPGFFGEFSPIRIPKAVVAINH